MTATKELMPAAEVRSLLTTFRPANSTPSDATVEAWRHALGGASFGECQAALLAAGPSAARTATPEQILARIKAARTTARPERDRVVRLDERRKRAERTEYAAAASRGVERIYAQMGWQRNPDRALAQRVSCPFCYAPAGRMCRPLSRDRTGRAERRDSASLTHPSRLERARAEFGDHS